MSEYDDQANKFMSETGTTIDCARLGTFPYFDGDKDSRDVFYITLKRGAKAYSFKFGDSIQNTRRRAFASRRQPLFSFVFEVERGGAKGLGFSKDKEKLRVELLEARKDPSVYSVLACLTKSDPGTFEDFCSDYGYDTDSIKAHDTYHKVQEEWDGVRGMFSSEELEQLQEIN